jgi:hypothetical protein
MGALSFHTHFVCPRRVLVTSGTYIMAHCYVFALCHGHASRNDTELPTISLNVMPAGMQVLPMMVLLFVVVVIIILRAAWKPLPVPDAAQRQALLNKAKQQAG